MAVIIILLHGLLGSNPKEHDKAGYNDSVPHARWLSDRLADEQLSYKYPSDWNKSTGAQTAVSSGSNVGDAITLTSPSNLMVTMQTGITNAPDLNHILSSVPLATMGSDDSLNFYNSITSDTGLAQGACVQTAAASSSLFPISSNISSQSGTPYNVICLTYPEDEAGKVLQNTVSAFQADPYYGDALKIIGSLSYN